jgi:Tol biopolymer transport system component
MSAKLLLSSLFAGLLAVSGAAPAGAASGPENGRITFGRSSDPGTEAFTLWVANSDGSNQQQLVIGPSGFSDWSPDGTRIAFDFEDDTGVHIATMNADGTDRRVLTDAPGVQETPEWSPDGEWITYAEMDASLLPDFRLSIWVIRADGTGARRVTSGGFDVEPVFSPDGTRIAFSRITNPGEGDPQIQSLLTVNTDGTDVREVVAPRAGLQHPDWSPDGKWLGFDISSWQRDLPDSGALLVVRPDGTALHVVRAPTANLRFYKIGWSPDGHRLLMGCFDLSVQRDRLCTSTAGGGNVRPIDLGDDSWVNYPAWGPQPTP